MIRNLLVILIFGIPAALFAQKTSVSVEVGTSVSNFIGDVSPVFSKYRIGASVGLGLEIPTSPITAVKIGGYFQQKGQNYKGDFIVPGQQTKYNNNTILNYITVPLLYKVYFGENSISVSAGAYGSYMLFATADIDQSLNSDGDVTVTNEDNVDVASEYENLDVGLQVGVTFYPGKNSFLDLKSSWGVYNIASSENDISNIKNQAFEIIFGIKF